MPSQRIHKPLLLALEAGLTSILKKKQPADKFLLNISRQKQFGSRDRKFIAQHLYDVIRYRRLFDTVFEEVPVTESSRYFSYVIMNLIRHEIAITNADDILDDEELIPAWKRSLEDSTRDLKTTLSFTDWMWEKGTQDYQKDWDNVALSLNSSPITYVRANTLKTTVGDLKAALAKIEVESKVIAGTDALQLLTRRKLSNHELYRNGLFEFQDLASQAVAGYCDLGDDMIVLDTCAGAGGKSLHLAALMNNTGSLIASDKMEDRLKQLEYRAKRNGVTNVKIIQYTHLADWQGKADRVVIDAPCTATGTIWRKPEIKWKVDGPELEKYTQIQRLILKDDSKLVKIGGLVIYATCSLFKEEGEVIVKEFLAQNNQFELKTERRFLPATDQSDGFYIAVIVKK